MKTSIHESSLIRSIFFLAASSLLLSSCIGQSSTSDYVTIPAPGNTLSSGYKWTRLTDSASFPKSYNFQLFSIRDTIWAFHSDGNWYSTDGIKWTKSKLTNSIRNLAFLDYVQFDNAILGLGHFEGNIEKFTLTPNIYRTTDLKDWTVAANASNLPRRFFYHPFVFNAKVWIIGGEDGTRQFADVWNSEDGVHWTKRADNLAFGKRAGNQFVIFNEKIFMLNNDVWSSADGLNWKRETEAIAPGEEIFGYSAIVMDNKIWLLGCSRNGKFKSEILVSDDGKTWRAEEAPWSPRGGIAACVHKGKIYMTGGKYGGPGIADQTEFVYSNDVWMLEKNETAGKK
jgi:hypothetical protein